MSIMVFTLIAAGSIPSVALASKSDTTTKKKEITNLNYITQTDEKLEYTFTKDGEDYKYIEYLKEDEVVSHLYKKNPETNDFKKYDVVTTTVLEDEEAIRSHSDFTGKTEKTDVSSMTETGDGEGSFNITSAPGPGGYEFEYHSTTYGTNTPSKWTIGAIGITIAAITKVPASVKWVTNIANLTFQTFRDKVYYSYAYYKKGSGIGTRVTRTVKTVYANSARTDLIGNAIHDSSRSGRELVETNTFK